ncbi:zinc ribbon domain-containing protein YjdM [Litoribrevibacter albus]|uniref:Phosphonoacetate hydrolase n=1 Tax=Litoribrevibacter albus TaxID=1473156 RepID=A0AA37S6N4_9GAMM|nr:zinc ribbon domain-containing protein YjdM [Litoribrevibacter albus]GLQ29962.1 phosphonoacetate hydrolase [Litoribrevibacter albus]
MPNCPKCDSEYPYEDGPSYICPECVFEWPINQEEEDCLIVKDSVGNILSDGDSVTVIKDLKVKGSSSVVKVGTKIKNIRLVDSPDNHNIDCKVEGVGAIKITPKYVKKA